MSIIRRAYEAVKSVVNEPPPRQAKPKTMVGVLHYLWSERTGTSGYDKDEKQLWMALQRFVERKRGIQASIEDYRA